MTEVLHKGEEELLQAARQGDLKAVQVNECFEITSLGVMLGKYVSTCFQDRPFTFLEGRSSIE